MAKAIIARDRANENKTRQCTVNVDWKTKKYNNETFISCFPAQYSFYLML